MPQVVMDCKNVSGIFQETDAMAVLDELEMRNIRPEEINVMMSEHTGNSALKMRAANKAPEGATIGGISGGLVGALIGGLTLVGSVLAPGVGLLAAGPLVGALAGTAAGVGAGGLIGGLIGMGFPEHEAKFYQDALHEEGNTLIVVQVPKEATDEIKALFNRFNVKNYSEMA